MRKRTAPLGECSIENCTRTAKYANTGWCQTHYHRWWRTGDPLGVKQERGASGPETVNWKGDAIVYRTAHLRVTRAKGSAAQHDCELCGGSAEQWAYDHSDPNEKIEETDWGPVAFSTDIERYQALCRSCHVKRDRRAEYPRKTHCINGHAFDEALVKRDGERACRACGRERMAAKRAALRARGLSSRGRELT